MFLNILKGCFIFRVGLFIILMMSGISNVYAVVSHPIPTLRNQFSKWSVYQYSDLNKTVCFALSVPSVSEPLEGVKHGVNFLIVSLKKGHNDSYLPELVMDYPLDEETMISVEVIGKYSSGQIFKMKPRNNRAIFEKRFDDDILIQAMKSGRALSVSAKSKRGTNTHYTFSLEGLSDALADVPKCQ
ncbi:hypothetical protein HUT03_05340 [Candidatus Liberibacter africanus]|uniref:Uncharacterized protein n=1 Tax=Candidatus Liberibacter africanus PTSAPSY TaxID=1277257 RepID=A0A0G3IA16_LIBAF|nr:hypothetical protein [Candidatus Liberibacter africanus]AKK20662.1 hypothetical protein G293_05255 [Candidatus Liberibacter africanus PTSAPSY]QTP64336.1 hypothetical protein HUT03_05340 [Candidatus Liberibacter africanus]